MQTKWHPQRVRSWKAQKTIPGRNGWGGKKPIPSLQEQEKPPKHEKKLWHQSERRKKFQKRLRPKGSAFNPEKESMCQKSDQKGSYSGLSERCEMLRSGSMGGGIPLL